MLAGTGQLNPFHQIQVSSLIMRSRFEGAQSFSDFLEEVQENREFWHSMARRAKVDEEAVARVARLPGKWHFLVLSEDWCGDAINTVPLFDRLAQEAPNLELRLLGRDANPDLMDTHLTNGSRSIPVVMILDEEFRELAWWGPRPRPLQEWVLSEGLELPPEERYAEVRRWYARDAGRTTIEEIVSLMESALVEARPGD